MNRKESIFNSDSYKGKEHNKKIREGIENIPKIYKATNESSQFFGTGVVLIALGLVIIFCFCLVIF